MRFICDKCKAKYSIADHKVQKKVLKIRCKKCSNIIIVRDPTARQARAGAGPLRPVPATSPAAPQASKPKHPAYQAHQAEGASIHTSQEEEGRERTVVARISADWLKQLREEKQEEPVWFIALGGSPIGPTVLSELQAHIKSGRANGQNLVWRGGWADWIPASKVPALQSSFQANIAEPAPENQRTVQDTVSPLARQQESLPDHGPEPSLDDIPESDDELDAAEPTRIQSIADLVGDAPVEDAPLPVEAPSEEEIPVEEPASLTTQDDPFALEEKDSLLVPEEKEAPFALEEKEDPFALEEKEDPFALEVKEDPFALEEKPDPFALEEKEDPFALEEKPDPFALEEKPDPFALEEKPDPFALEEKEDPFALEEKEDPFALEEKEDPFLADQETSEDIAPAKEETSEKVETKAAAVSESPVDGQNIALESQALPAELDQLTPPPLAESSEEESFFESDLMARGSIDNGVLEVTLPPLPEEEAEDEFEEFDVDDADIIEIKETIKEKWTSRLIIGGGLLVLLLVSLPFIFGSQLKKDTPGKKGQKIALLKKIKKGRKLSKEEEAQRKALLEGKTYIPRRVAPKKRKKVRGRSTARRVVRRKITPITSKQSSSALERAQLAALAAASKRLGIKVKTKPTGPIPKGISRSMYKRIIKTLNKHMGKVKYCYENYLRKVVVQGRLIMELEIRPSGDVAGVRAMTRRFRGKPITNCIQRTMKRWTFDAFNGSENIRLQVPYDLKPVF